MDQPLISVIVPVYKVEDYLYQCVDSILNQTYKNLEIILVDDGSPDHCPVICDSYALRDERVRVIHKANGGPGAARNDALDIAAGSYIAFVDSDDWLEPTAYEEMLRFSQDRDLDVVYCVPNEITEERVSGTRYHYYPDRTVCDAKTVLIRTLKNEISAEPWLKLCRKNCWEGIRFPDQRIYEDIAISHLVLARAEKSVGFIDHPLYNYRINPSGLTQTRKENDRYYFFLALKERYIYALKNERTAVDKACMLAARFAMGTYLDSRVNHWVSLDSHVIEAMTFMKKNRKRLLGSKAASPAEKTAMLLYYYARPVFCGMYYLFDKIREKGSYKGIF